MTDTTELMNTDTTTEQTPEVKVEPMATDEANTAIEPAESSTATDKGEDKKPTENGTAESTTDSTDSPPKLFVGRLPIGTKDAQLKELFGTYGEVTHCDIVGKYGFVHMKNKEEADEAMKNLNNHAFNGSSITVQMSTSTAKKTKKKPNRKNFDNKKVTNNANTSTNSNQATPNRRQNVKNGFQQKNKNTNGNNNNSNNKSNINNSNNANNRNKNGNVNNNLGHNRQNGAMNKMRGRKFNNNHRMHPMMPQLAPMNQGYYQNNHPPMNPQPYYQPPMPQHQMQPVGGPRDMYNSYNSRPIDNGQYYRSNGPSPQPMYGGGMPPQVPPQPNYYPQQQQPYNRVPVGTMGKMNPMPPTHQPQPSMYGSPMSMGPMSASPASMNTGYGQMNSGYANSPMMNTNGVNKYVGGYTNY